MGETRYADCSVKDDAIVPFPSDDLKQRPVNKVVVQSEKYENVYGSYVHGIFDQAEIANAILRALAQKKGITIGEGELLDYQAFKEKQYDELADTLREYLNMEEIYGMLREADLD